MTGDQTTEGKDETRRRRRSKVEIARDKRLIGDLYLEGLLQSEIGEKLGLSQSTISRDLESLEADWIESGVRDLDEAKGRELARIDRLEREYWLSWRRSCQPSTTRSRKTRGQVTREAGDDEGVFTQSRPAELDVTVKERDGNPAFLAGVQWCIDRRCKILGLDAAQRVKHQGDPDRPIGVKFDLSSLPLDVVRSLAGPDDDTTT